jgi:hypothetical protein
MALNLVASVVILLRPRRLQRVRDVFS